jgi:hypothetical protein
MEQILSIFFEFVSVMFCITHVRTLQIKKKKVFVEV